MTARSETQKRLDLAYHLKDKWTEAEGVILTGSVAYSPNFCVKPNSDLDLLVIHNDIKEILPDIQVCEADKQALLNRTFEGYSLKSQIDGVPVSLHILSRDSFDIITKCYVADIRLYRTSSKKQTYDLFGYSGQRYSYTVKNILLPDLEGARVIVPVYFISDDRHYVGIHRDKLLSNPQILHDSKGIISQGIETLWEKIIHDVKSEQKRVDPSASVISALSRKDRFTPQVLEGIKAKEQKYLSQF